MYKFTLQGKREGTTCVLGNSHVFKKGVLIADDSNGAKMQHSLVKYYGVKVELFGDEADASKPIASVPATPVTPAASGSAGPAKSDPAAKASTSETATKTAAPGSGN